MEQRLDATYLRPALFERAAAVGISAVAIGMGILLGAWGISLLWANPEVHLDATIKVEPPPAAINGSGGDAKTPTGEVIRREVTVFSTVKHGTGQVTTGWRYRDGTGGVPSTQYCYYSAPNIDHSSTRVDIAVDQSPLPNINASLVPELEGALAKCQWWQR
jgi:hypothetical protein